MITPDFGSRTYTAEILRARKAPDIVAETIARMTVDARDNFDIESPDGLRASITHSFSPSTRAFHRSTRRFGGGIENDTPLPRVRKIRGKDHFLYDVLVARRGSDFIIAVPFHGLAESFFVQIDSALAGKKAVYEKLDITNLVMKLGEGGMAAVSGADGKLEIGLTRCQLAYSDPQNRTHNLNHVSMSGARIGATDIYSFLTGPVLSPTKSHLTVTPVLLGFSLFADGVKKTSATTDRHGNFKIWIGPGATRLERLFSLLDGIETIKGVASTTSNLPILQSNAIRGINEDVS